MQRNFNQMFKKTSVKSNTQDKITNILLVCVPNPANIPLSIYNIQEMFSNYGEVKNVR